jgi:hypothetical protein
MTTMDHPVEHLSDEVELSAIVAHGLLNTLAVIAGSAATMQRFGSTMSAEQHETMIAALVSHSELFTEGLDVLLRHCSDAFADAAWIVESIGRRFRSAPADDRQVMLERLATSTATLRSGLQSLVRGLPPDTIDLLDSLQHR